ncbi:MAG: histidinol-phosphate transaminase [Bacteroidia bacterium]|nr:histidinol-phosphate transaminase [Bacteroidia bacterium]
MPRFRTHLAGITPYRSARDEFEGEASIFLDANENPYAPQWDEPYHRYPDPHHERLRTALSEWLAVPPEQIMCGAGSDELIDWLIRVTCEPFRDALLTLTPSYGVYATYGRLHGALVREVQLSADFDLPVEALLHAASDSTPIAFLCRPNNPTGTFWPVEKVKAFLDQFHGWAVLDEAYVEFSSDPSGWLPHRRPGTILLRTFSKAWGMAGWRLGYAIADEEVVSLFYRTKLPYNLSAPAQEAGIRVIRRWSAIAPYVQQIREERARLAQILSELPWVDRVYPSEANFLLVRLPNAMKVYHALLQRGIVTRYRGTLPLCEDTIRITVGTTEENDRLIETLCAIFS